MTIRSSGVIKFSDLNIELGYASNRYISLNELNTRKLAMGSGVIPINSNGVLPVDPVTVTQSNTSLSPMLYLSSGYSTAAVGNKVNRCTIDDGGYIYDALGNFRVPYATNIYPGIGVFYEARLMADYANGESKGGVATANISTVYEWAAAGIWTSWYQLNPDLVLFGEVRAGAGYASIQSGRIEIRLKSNPGTVASFNFTVEGNDT